LLTLSVAPTAQAQGIEISINPTSANIRRGSERYGLIDLRVGPIGNYSKMVTVSAESVPSGMGVSFDGYPTKSGVPPLSSEVVVSVPREVALGEYVIVFKAVGEDGTTDSTTYRLRVMEEYIPGEEKVEVEVLYIWVGVGVAAVMVAVILLMVYLRMRARREWAPAPPAPPAPAPPAS